MIRRGTVSIRSEVQALKETLSKANYVLEAIRQVLVKMSRLEESIIDAGVREPPLKPFLLTLYGSSIYLCRFPADGKIERTPVVDVDLPRVA